ISSTSLKPIGPARLVRPQSVFQTPKNSPELWIPVPLEDCMKTYYWLKQNRLLSHLRFATSLSLILSAFVISASSSSAAPAQTYNGTFTGGDFFFDGELLDPPPYSVTGTWNLNIDPQTPAQVTLNVFYNSSH